MARIKAFRFRWADAWSNTDKGCDTIIETSDSGKISIQFLVDQRPFTLDLTGREDEFINDIAFVKQWDKKVYQNNNIMDGTKWSLHFTYDGTAVITKGSNAFPKDFQNFLDILHDKYDVPKAKLEKDTDIGYCSKHGTFTDDPDLGLHAVYEI